MMQSRLLLLARPVFSKANVLLPRRFFFDKIKAAASAFIADPKAALSRKEKITQSDRKFPGAPQSLADAIDQASGGGLAGAVLRTTLKFVVGRVEKAITENQVVMNDILYNAAQQLEADPRVVRVFGPMVRIQGPELGGEGSQSVHHHSTNGVSKTEFHLQVVVTSGGSGTGSAGGRTARGLATIHATSISDQTEITKLLIDTPGGTIDVLAGSGGVGGKAGARRVQGVTTIDVKPRE